MLLRKPLRTGSYRTKSAAFTLAEVTMCIAVAGVIISGIFAGYLQFTNRAQHSEAALSVLGLVQAKDCESPVETLEPQVAIALVD